MGELTNGNFNPANDDVMRRLLQDAGIEPGMAILDVGSGPGDVSFLAAELTGPAGSVVGLDHNPRAIQMATARSRELGVENRVRFEAADLAHPATDGQSFDALIGRRVLMYLPNPATSLKALVSRVRPGGVVAFLEHSPSSLRNPGHPAHDRMAGLAWEMVRREGGDPAFAVARLFQALEAAGSAVQGIRAQIVVQTPGCPYPYAKLLQVIAPRLVATGLIKETEFSGGGLNAARLEREASQGVHFGDIAISAWARV